MDHGKVGNNVTIPIPLVDRGRGDPRNIMGRIFNIDGNDNYYTIAVKSGILCGKYTRNQFYLCTYELYSKDNVIDNRELFRFNLLFNRSQSRVVKVSPNAIVLV